MRTNFLVALLSVVLFATSCGQPAVSDGTSLPAGITTTTGVPTSVPRSTVATSTTAPVPTSAVSTTWSESTTTTTAAPATTTSTTAAALDSGISGLVTIGPIQPVEQPGVPNTKPYAATIVIKRSDGTVAATVQSGADGRFTVKLPPGTYTLEPQSGQPLPRAESQQVVVEPHRFTDVTIAYDSGIR